MRYWTEGIEDYEEELLDYDEEGILEKGEIIEEAANTSFVLKKAWGGGRALNHRRSISVFQKEAQNTVQHDLGGVQSIRRSSDQCPTVPRGKKSVVWETSTVADQHKVVRVVSVAVDNSPFKMPVGEQSRNISKDTYVQTITEDSKTDLSVVSEEDGCVASPGSCISTVGLLGSHMSVEEGGTQNPDILAGSWGWMDLRY
ncbi:hypothetical protein NDU88_002330 [Pleurodeles waltl]|uniref:Uncharacterized protein n=1 Tax=Pleurodeles waltl TaxID=8319 RepID=A0AAV7WPZ3_PLEWA|nr:hypothetical protein NDU88_002330 [Pleurodeles waltl]